MRRLALLPALLLAGSCYAGLLSDDEAHAKIGELQKQQGQLQEKLQSLETRLAGQEKAQRAQGMEMLSQLEAMRNEMAKLRGQIEEHAHGIEATQKRQRDLYVDLDSRLRLLEQQRAAQPVVPPVVEEGKSGKGKKSSAKAAEVPVDAAPAMADPVAEGKAYDAAFNLFRVGNYQGALAAFQSFIQSYPKSPLAPSSQYWIGNSYFNLKDFDAAIASQQALISQYPKSPKVPDAMLNIATCQQNQGDMDGARKMLEDLVAKFPLSDAGEKAKKRLAASK